MMLVVKRNMSSCARLLLKKFHWTVVPMPKTHANAVFRRSTGWLVCVGGMTAASVVGSVATSHAAPGVDVDPAGSAGAADVGWTLIADELGDSTKVIGADIGAFTAYFGSQIATAIDEISVLTAPSSLPGNELDAASTNLQQGADALAPLTSNSDGGDFAGSQGGQLEAYLPSVTMLQTAENAISSHSGLLSVPIDQLIFNPLDQAWVGASETELEAAQALAAAIASGSGVNADEIGSFTAADLEMDVLRLLAVPIDYLGALF